MQVQQEIDHQLARAVIGHLPTTITLYDRNVTGGQQMGCLAGLTLCEHWMVLQKPEFVFGVVRALCGEMAHLLEDRRVVHTAQFPTGQRCGVHSDRMMLGSRWMAARSRSTSASFWAT